MQQPKLKQVVAQDSEQFNILSQRQDPEAPNDLAQGEDDMG